MAASGFLRRRAALALVLLVYVVLSVAYNVLQPIGEAPDEPAHFEFVQYIQQHWSLPRYPPDAPAHLDPLAPGIEFDQVPLYYTVLAVLLRPIWLPAGAALHRDPFIGWPGHPWQRANDLHRTDEGWPYHGLALAVHAGRMLSTVLGLITLLATHGVVRRILHPGAALFATAWLGWSPGFLLSSSHLNNDNAVVAASSLVLLASTLLLTSRNLSAGHVGGIAVALTAAMLSKVSAILLLPLVLASAAGATIGGRSFANDLTRRVGLAAAVVTPALGALGIWWALVGHTYDRRLAVAVGTGVASAATKMSQINWARFPTALSWFNSTWWGGIGAGVETPWPPEVYAVLAAPVVVLLTAGAFVLVRGSDRLFGANAKVEYDPPENLLNAALARWNSWSPKRRVATLLVLETIPFFYATITRQVFTWVDLDANARFVLPVASAIALVVALGGLALPLGRERTFLAFAYVTSILGLSIATAIYLFPQISAPVIPARLASSDAEASAPAIGTFASGVDLIAVDNVPKTIQNVTDMHLTLRWRVTQKPSESFIVFSHVVGGAADDRVMSSKDETPYQKTFPPTLWQMGEIIDQPQSLQLVHDLRPGLYTLQIGMYRLNADQIQPILVTGPGQSGQSVVVARWKVLPTRTAEDFRAVGAQFGDDLSLDAGAINQRADGTQVILTWRALRPPARRLVISVQALDAAGRLIAQHDGEPVDGRLPTTSWDIGDVIEDSALLPGVSTSKNCNIIVVVYDRETLQRLPVTRAGQSVGDHVTIF